MTYQIRLPTGHHDCLTYLEDLYWKSMVPEDVKVTFNKKGKKSNESVIYFMDKQRRLGVSPPENESKLSYYKFFEISINGKSISDKKCEEINKIVDYLVDNLGP